MWPQPPTYHTYQSLTCHFPSPICCPHPFFPAAASARCLWPSSAPTPISCHLLSAPSLLHQYGPMTWTPAACSAAAAVSAAWVLFHTTWCVLMRVGQHVLPDCFACWHALSGYASACRQMTRSAVLSIITMYAHHALAVMVVRMRIGNSAARRTFFPKHPSPQHSCSLFTPLRPIGPPLPPSSCCTSSSWRRLSIGRVPTCPRWAVPTSSPRCCRRPQQSARA